MKDNPIGGFVHYHLLPGTFHLRPKMCIYIPVIITKFIKFS